MENKGTRKCFVAAVQINESLSLSSAFSNVKRSECVTNQECPEKEKASREARREEEEERKKVGGRKFMRHRRELLLLNKTLKYLITVPVISVPMGDRKSGRGLAARDDARIESDRVSRYAVLTAFAKFSARDS